ncbi:MAG TPA: 2-hydroxyacyl-CoA dehydratase family protein [bacterium]|jgi:benzoyl-CoA reductase/2-hydroxyglutaryl-CoA dehydratase subunit BcrC/BadD/HgdB|nr:2-hydroxyacyl-CoA dehydratase family protein [bacterium]HNZ53969.1 2-hydroxyacyl-CoA dehydratase family protein [bacterium]HOG43020.1 2-hydroxyacyl-CoA dehydratase family protein [bacterium]HRQ69416.1 2-hydroxyacyl-CoA dehydratase family protein [bacterium]
MKRTAAFTTSVPVEVILAAGFKPLDLNNIFVSAQNPYDLVEKAEVEGFAGSSCAWIKGLYSVMTGGFLDPLTDVFIAVTEGDCSNAKVLEQIVSMKTGIRSFIFNYPYERDAAKMSDEIDRFAKFMGTTLEKCESVRSSLSSLRKKLKYIDELSYKFPGIIKGVENHLFLVSSSDFNGDPVLFEKNVDDFLKTVEERKSGFKEKNIKKIAYLGVPPIVPIHEFIEKKGAVVIYNEIQREFAMLDECDSLALQYTNYSYPYSARFRFEKALSEIKKRKPDGIIHYVQSFCHRQLEDIILRTALSELKLEAPVLTIEFDKPAGNVDARVATRIEAFLETI